MADVADYPEHEKMLAVKEAADAQGEFLDWLLDQGYVIARLREFDEYDHPVLTAEAIGDRWKNARLAEHHGIDLDKIEAEKRSMLNAMRAANRG